MIRILPRVNGIVDRRHLARYPFFGLTGAGGTSTRIETARAGGIATSRAGNLDTARAGGIATARARG